MGEQPALGDCPDAAIPVPECRRDPGLTGPWFKPEMGLQCRDCNHAFGRVVLAHEAKRHATTVREYLRFNVSGFHGRSGGSAIARRQDSRIGYGGYQSAHGHQGCEALIRLARESRITSGGDYYL